MNTEKIKVHFIDNYLINPTNPVSVNLVGAGGTGSQVLTALARINQSLIALQHPGLAVKVFDDDKISEANLGRQLFALSEIGLNKAAALINRLNRFFGTNWKAVTHKYNQQNLSADNKTHSANITISCVDSAPARFEIAGILKRKMDKDMVNRPIYWLDFGNGKETGQVLLSTIYNIKQPASKNFNTVAKLPFITEEFKQLLKQSDSNDEPSCSLAEALTKQDLFINSALANIGASLLWNMFREAMIVNRGFFLNLKTFTTQPIKI